MNLKYPAFWNTKSLLSTILLPLSLIYFIASVARKLLVKAVKFPAPVICVGNITVGGTGKTQVVKWLAEILHKQNKKVLIICKGYNSKIPINAAELVITHHSAAQVGDEAKYLSNTAPVIVSSKPKNALALVKRFAPDIIILDDFLQNPGVVKNLNIIVVDNDRLFGNNRLIPAGPLRESFTSASKDAAIIIAIGSKPNNTPTLLGPKSFVAQIISTQPFDLSKKYLAFAGIGNPQRFFSCLRQHGLSIIEEIIFPDHHIYSAADLGHLESRAAHLQAQLITTPKDAVKVDIKVSIFQPELKFQTSPEEILHHKIMQITQLQ